MKIFEGQVISNKMHKTAVVEVISQSAHPVYKKLIKKSKKYKVDTNTFPVSVGNIVTIEETRPMSKDKNFKITKVVKAGTVLISSEETVENIKEPAIQKAATAESTEAKVQKVEKVEESRKSSKGKLRVSKEGKVPKVSKGEKKK